MCRNVIGNPFLIFCLHFMVSASTTECRIGLKENRDCRS